MIFLHISNGSEIRLMSISKLFVDTSVSFLKKGSNYYLPLSWEYSGFRFINDSSKKEKKWKKWIGESGKIIPIYNYS